MRLTDAPVPGKAQFAIVADDLTGACDSAVAFAQRGLPVRIMLDRKAAPQSDGVWAISTESRDIAEDAAVLQVCDSLIQASQAEEVFKKVDSVFRGNTFAEIRATVENLSHDLAVLSPAYPLMGRTVCDGVLHIKDRGHDRTVDLYAGLHKSGLKDLALLRKSAAAHEMNSAMRGGCKLVLCDAESDEDLRHTVSEARNLGKRVLWIGSGGLAFALASELPENKTPLRSSPAGGVLVLFVGSDHVVTKRQIAALHASAAAFEASVEKFTHSSLDHRIVILNVLRGVTTEDQIRSSIEQLIPQGIACCLMTGGDTAMLVCRALGVHSLQLTEEFAPGLPQGIALGGTIDRVPVILKSGGFGKDDVLCQLSHRFANRKEYV